MTQIVLKNTSREWLKAPVRVAWDGAPVVLTAGKQKIPGQVEEQDSRKYLVFMAPAMKAKEELRLTAEETAGAPAPGVTVRDDGRGKVDVLIGKELFTTYHYSAEVVRPYLNPVIGPEGKSVVRKPASPGNPEKIDHHHHRGIWVAHGDTNGTDNWSEEQGHGGTVHRKFAALTSGPVFGKIHALSDWVSNKGKKILEEERIITIYDLPPEGRLIDHKLILKASEGEVVFKDTKESGLLSVRVAPSMEVNHTGWFENGYGGINEAECWGKRAPWCDYCGKVDGVLVGIAVFDFPENLRYPTWWHIRNYGLMTANFLGLSDFTGDKKISGTYVLPAYQQLTLLYRIYVHAGNTADARVRERFLNFLYPPAVEIT